MKHSSFIETLQMAIDTTEDLEMSTILGDLDSYDSLAILSIIAMADGSFDKKLTAEDFANVTTVESLMKIIGMDNFEEG